ncbi:MAG TPA: helicase HerA-like domain-containing protein [Terriglobales bacterium]|nr:helicase HerA-like domain-containing protein [Terriglobales bacterium]
MSTVDGKVVAAAKQAFPSQAQVVTLGAVVYGQACDPEPIINVPLSMMNRHGLIAGATGTGKTKTLQVMTEQLSAAGVPIFLADLKGDLSGLAVPGESNDRVVQRAKETGYTWTSTSCPVEYLSLTGARGAQLRATVSSFGSLLLSKVLGLNDTQASVLSLVFKYCDDRKLPLLDFSDLRSVLQYLTGEGAGDLKDYGGLSTTSVGVLLRDMVQLEQQGAQAFFGEPEFNLSDLMQQRNGRGLVSILELLDVQDKPAMFSTFMLWMLARLYHDLPEVGDVDKPKLVFFFDEAHLLFENASKAFLDEIEQVVRLIRSKGVGIFFVTQNPKDVPPNILGQLGHRVEHALRAFTPDDEKALKAAAMTFPKTPFYDIQQTLTTLGIGEALVTVLSPNGVPTPPFVTRLIPPATRMGPLTDAELTQFISTSAQVKEYAQPIDRDSAREMLASRIVQVPQQQGVAQSSLVGGRPPPNTMEQILRSPATKAVGTAVVRGLFGALVGPPPRRRREY